MLGLLLLETANLILLGFYDNLQISTNLGSLKWRELSPQVTEGVPARRRQRAQNIIAVRISRHHPSAVAATLLGEEGKPMPELCTEPKAPSPRELSRSD